MSDGKPRLTRLGAILLGVAIALPLSLLPLASVSVRPPGPHGCFGGQPRTPAEAAALPSVVKVGTGGFHLGTAFALDEGRGTMVLTAAHVVGGLRHVELTGHDGRALGRFEVVSLWNPRPVPGSGGALLGDLARLVPAEGAFLPPPLRPSPARGASPLFVRMASPGGPDIGTSGAPVLDSEGGFLGMVTHSNSPALPRRFLVGYGGDPLRPSVPRSGWAFADPISEADSPSPVQVGPAFVPAYPWGHCLLSRGARAEYAGDMRSAADRIHATGVP